MSEPVLPPAGDPKRQATGAQRGFLYQAWQAADAWLRLGANDVLFLEHAEDYDVVTKGGRVVSVQVKGEAGELSLGRAKARDAIGQFWDLRERNLDRSVSYRYLTTRARGSEQGLPFGERCGLDVWDGARRSDDDLQALRAFLSAQALPQGVLDLLATGTKEEVRAGLVLPLHWDTEAPDAGVVQDLVEERLVAYGDARALPVSPSVSQRVAAAVFLRVTERSAAEAPRRLTRSDFATLFEEATTERVPAGADAAGAARLARTPSPLPRAGSPGFLERVEGTRLPVVLPREALVATVLERARALALSAIVGSTGAGKTIVAELAAGEDGGWYRLDLRDLTPDGMRRRLDDAALALADLPDGATVLLDDLAVSGGVNRIITALERVVVAARQKAIHLVVTSPSELPSRVVLLTPEAGAETSLPAPMLTEPEMGHLAEGYGCPPALVGVWARVLAIKTSGHPQLASAFATNARARGWPEPGVEDIAGDPAPIADVRAEARATLGEALRGGEAFDLVQRLSVFSLPFTRAHALRLAQAPPPLRMAALDLDALVGPWIEATPDGRYRMSPLLAGLYKETRPRGEHAGLHGAAADAVVEETLMSGSLDAYDLGTLLRQAVLGDNGPALAFGASLAKQASDFARMADYLDWFTVVATGDAQQPLVPSSLAASLIGRELQFSVALEVGRDVGPMLDAWEFEIDRVAAAGEPVEGLRLLAALAVMMNPGVDVSTDRLVRAAAVVLDRPEAVEGDVEEVMQRAFDGQEAPENGMLRALEASGRAAVGLEFTSAFVFSVLGSHPTAPEGVAAFVEAALDAPSPVGPAARRTFGEGIAMTESVVSKLWIRAKDARTDTWDSVLAGFDRLSEIARLNDMTALAVSVERDRAVVLYEEVGDWAAAEAALDDAEGRLGSQPRLEAYRGTMLRIEQDFTGALAVFEDLLPGWREEAPNTSLLYVYHDAIESAGMVGAWDRAAHWAGVGEAEAARLGEDSYVRLCYAVDRAFAAFKEGRPCDAIAGLQEVLTELPEPSDARLRMLHRRTTHVIAWIAGEVGGLRTGGLLEPSPGLASRFDSDPDESALPQIVLGLSAVLDEAADMAGCAARDDDVAADEGGTYMERSMRVRRSLNEGIRMSALDLPDRYVATIAALGRAVAEQAAQPHVASMPDLAGTLVALTYGVVAAVAAEPVRPDVLGTWRERLRALFGDTGDVQAWSAVAEDAFTAAAGVPRSLIALTDVARDGERDPNHRTMAAAALAKASRDPHVRGQSLALLAATAAVHPFGMSIGAALASLSGRDVPPGQGVREAARAVLSDSGLSALRLSPELIGVLRETVDDGPTWGMERRGPDREPPASR